MCVCGSCYINFMYIQLNVTAWLIQLFLFLLFGLPSSPPLLPLPSSSGTQCEVGKYQPLEGKVTCKADQCAQGTYGNGGVGGGSVGRDSPQACENCPQGRYDVYIIMVYYIL
jgi:hypothetical protein